MLYLYGIKSDHSHGRLYLSHTILLSIYVTCTLGACDPHPSDHNDPNVLKIPLNENG